MQKFALVMACLACAAQARRAQSSVQQPQRDGQQALRALETLLTTDDLAAAFNSLIPGGRVAVRKGPASRAPVMSLNNQLKGAYKSLTRSLGDQTKSLTAAALAFTLLFSPALDVPAPLVMPPAIVQAKELASGAGSQVNKDPESLLRFALPNQPKEIKVILEKLEEARTNIEKKNGVVVVGAVNSAKQGLEKKKIDVILKSIPPASAEEAKKVLAAVIKDVEDLSQSSASADFKTSDAKANSAINGMAKITELAASGFKQPAPPDEYSSKLPYLKGRASIDLTIKRPNGKFNILGTFYEQIDLTMVVDGYKSPITAGNFVDLVNRGFYDNFEIQRADGFVVQTGDPSAAGVPAKVKSSKTGFVPPGASKVRKIPLEVFVKDDKAPMYQTTFDDDNRGGYAAALPFNSYGALGMARTEFDLGSGSSQFFWLLFDSDLTPGGKNLLDGNYACFGMTTKNGNLLSDVKEGDVITVAKVTSGLENLVTPTER